MLINFINTIFTEFLDDNNKYYLSPSLQNENVIIIKDSKLIEVPNINVIPTPLIFERNGENITIKLETGEFICPINDNNIGVCDSNNINTKYWKLDNESLGIRFVNQNMCMGTGQISGISSDALATIRPLKMSICGKNPDPILSFDVFSSLPFGEKLNYELLSRYAVGNKLKNYNLKENPNKLDNVIKAQLERKPSIFL